MSRADQSSARASAQPTTTTTTTTTTMSSQASDAKPNVEKGPRPTYSFAACIRHPSDSKGKIYSVEFFPCPASRILAFVGGPRATLIELVDDQMAATTRRRVNMLRDFVDEDPEEIYYTCCWTLINDKPALCVAGEAGIIKVLDIEKCVLQTYLTGHGGPIYSMQTHPTDTDLVFTCGKDESIRIWSVAARRCLVIFTGDQGHRDAVLSLDCHHSGSWLATSGMDNTVKVWELDSDAVRDAIKQGRVVNLEDPEPKRHKAPFVQFPAFSTRRVHTDYVDCVRWVGDLLMSKSIESKCDLWKPDTRRRPNSVAHLRSYQYANGNIWFIHFGLDSNSTTVAVGSEKGKVYLFDVDTAGDAYQVLTHEKMRSLVRAVTFATDDAFLAACCDDGTVWIFERTGSSSDK